MFALPVTLGVFGLILVLARLKVPLALAVFLGAAAVGALFGLAPGEIARGTLAAAVEPQTIGLILITIILLALSRTMQASGQMEQIVALMRAMLRRPATAMMALPALIGLLPMPGGALFSAPMVASAAGADRAGKDRPAVLSAINYWFRHLWEYWWPLYPGVILAVRETPGDFPTFIAFQWPLTLFMFAGGLTILRGMHPDLHVKGAPAPPGTKRKLLWATSSIWVILLVWIPLHLALRRIPGQWFGGEARDAIDKFLPITVGLVVSLLWTVLRTRMPARRACRVFARGSIYAMAVLVLSVMVFRYMLEKVGAATRTGQELRDLHVPLMLVVMALPFVAGMVTGLAVGFVGTSFPIVVGLVAGMPDAPLRPYIVLAYAFGHLGQMCSPLHLCHVVSNQYFKTRFGPVYRYLLPAAAATAVGAVAYFLILLAAMS